MNKKELIAKEIVSVIQKSENKNRIVEDFKKKMILLKFINNLMTFISVAFIAYNVVLISNDIPGKEVIVLVVLFLVLSSVNTIKNSLKYNHFINNKEKVVDKLIEIFNYDFAAKKYEKIIFSAQYYFGKKNINKIESRINNV